MAHYNEIYVFRLACDPPLRVWSGIGDFDIPSDAIEPGGATYLGGAELINFPNLRQLMNGTAERVQVSVSGVDADTMRLLAEDAPSVTGAVAHFGTLLLDDDNQPVGTVDWEGMLRADVIEGSGSPDGNGGRTRNISLSLGSMDTGRSRAGYTFFTDSDQRRRSPDDAFFSNIARINGGTTRRFGPAK